MILICSAWDEETKYLDLVNKNIKIINLGIGYLSAAVHLDRFLQKADNNIERIVFIGTAGLISDKELEFGLGDSKIYSIQQVNLGDYLSSLDYSYTPFSYPIYEYKSLFKSADSITRAVVFSNLEITKSNEISKKIIEKYPNEILVENMEIYGVAAIAADHKIPFNSFLVTTNYTNSNAHQDWKMNHKEASRNLCDYVNKIIDIDSLHS